MLNMAQSYTGKEGTAIALGYFDGVHTGHQAVIGAAVQHAAQNGLSPAVFTFSQGERVKGRHLMNETQKQQALEALGVEYCFAPAFESFCSLTPEQFFRSLLLQGYRARAVFCGDNFCFGKNRAGNTAVLKTLCAQYGVKLHVVPTTLWQGQPVSSSRIRAALEAGQIEAANAMLGRPYAIQLPVQHGQGIGSVLGFPTINQSFPSWMAPPKQGVYITTAELNGTLWPSATGYGTRPTVKGTHPTCETFIPGFAGDLYEQSIPVRFYKRIADTTCFNGPGELAEAVRGWAAQALEYFAQNSPAEGA